MCSTDADDESTEAIATGGESTAACCMMTVAAATGAAAAAFIICFFDITLFALLVYTVVALLLIPHLGGGRCSYSIFFISPIVTIMIILILCHSSLLSMHLLVVRFILKAIVVKFNRPFISSGFDLDTAKFGRR